MSDLLKRMMTTSKSVTGYILSEADYFDKVELIRTPVPIINFALSGKFNGGLGPEALQIAAESKHFKTLYALLMIRSFLKQYPEGVVVFYDSEFGAKPDYFASMGINPDRIVWKPINIVQKWTHDIANVIDKTKEGDKVMIVTDSIGNLASQKESEDHKEGADKNDMTRAKAFKSAFRTISQPAIEKGIPMVLINHVYADQSGQPGKQIAATGTGVAYNANNTWFISRVQDRDTASREIRGYNFKIIIDKSRAIKERSTFDIEVTYDKGINIWSGLLNLALDTGHVTQSGAWYKRTHVADDKNWRKAESNCAEFWAPILKDPTFEELCRKKYCVASNGVLVSEEGLDVLEDEVANEEAI